MSETSIMTICGVEGYEEKGIAYLKLETVAKGLGFTRKAASGNEVVRWETVRKYLSDFGVPTRWHKSTQPVGREGLPEFISENIFYRLAMKAKNETAEKFQALVADEIIPSIRKTGGYIAGADTLSDEELMAKAFVVAQRTLAEREKRIAALTEQNKLLTPKAEYFDELVFRDTNLNFRDTAKELDIKEREFIRFLLNKGFVYRDKKGKLRPYARSVDDGLFVLKECYSKKTDWSGAQCLVTPKGRSTFRILMRKLKRNRG